MTTRHDDDALPHALASVDARLRRALDVPSVSPESDLARRVVTEAARPEARAHAPRAALAVSIGALAAAVALIVVPARDDDGFRAKGARDTAPTVSLVAKRDGALVPVTDEIVVSDSLMVAYTNTGAAAARALAVFAVDDDGRVFWLYPAYVDEKRPPSSIPISEGAGIELPDEIHHELAAGPLRFMALFTLTPISVIDVERFIADERVRPFSGTPRFAGAVVTVQDVMVREKAPAPGVAP